MDEGSFLPKLCPMGIGEPVEEDMEITHPESSGTDSFRFEDEDGLDRHAELGSEDSFFLFVVLGLSFSWRVWVAGFYYVFLFMFASC